MIIGTGDILDSPEINFSQGLLTADLETLQGEFREISKIVRGKVRDIVVVEKGGKKVRVMVTTDRLSAYDRLICTIPGKGEVLNMMSAWGFKENRDIVPNHMIDTPHPNVLVAKEAKATLPVEVVLRRYMAKSSTSTSVYHNYVEKGRRDIYGIKFPDNIRANEEFPMGTILTPTTKAETGHDEEITDNQAAEIVDRKLGDGIWEQTKKAAHRLFTRARNQAMPNGLLLVDTKYEFGLDENGNVMLIDELHTPDSSRYWFEGSYMSRFEEEKDPENFDKELIRRWLAQQKFTGNGLVPVVDPELIKKVAEAYTVPYEMITNQKVSRPHFSTDDMRGVLRGVISQLQ